MHLTKFQPNKYVASYICLLDRPGFSYKPYFADSGLRHFFILC